MRVWSKGLGTMVLNMDMRNYFVELEDGNLLIKGKIVDPVFWNFVITFQKDDIRGFANVFTKWRFVLYVVKNIPYVLKFFFGKIFSRSQFEHPKEKIEILTE